MRTVRIGIALFLLASAEAMAQGYSTNFDAGAAGWTLDAPVNGVAWAADATPAGFPFGPSRTGLSLNYNNGTDYAGDVSGSARSPAVDLSVLTDPVVEFWCNYHTETRGPLYDQRFLQILDSAGTGLIVEWQVASVGYSFTLGGGILGIGPGPCSEAYDDLETGTPVSTWHQHRVFLDPAWGTIHVRFVFRSVDDQRNGTSGWAIDDLDVKSHSSPAPAAWPDIVPDDDTMGNLGTFELDTCQTRAGGRMSWSWGASNVGDPGVHLIAGDHPDSVLDGTFLFFDAVHGHRHLSQWVDFALWKARPFGFQKVRRGPKRSFCLADVIAAILPPEPQLVVPPWCSGVFEGISYGWQDIYPIDTPGQDMDVSGLATGTDYTLIGVSDPINRFRERDEMNQVDQIHFTLPATVNTPVGIIDRTNPYPQTAIPLSITSAAAGTFQGVAAVQVLGTGFDTTLVPVLYDAGSAVAEAPFYTIASSTEIWVDVPAGITTPVTIDLLRARGDATSARIQGTPTLPPAVRSGSRKAGYCGATGAEFLLSLFLFWILRRTARRPV